MRTHILSLLLLSAAGPVAAQDTLRLAELHEAALREDPRVAQLELLERASDLRQRNLAVERLPSFRLAGEASYQSDVPELPISLPGVSVPEVPKERYQATLSVDQLLYDGGMIDARQAVERARLAASQAAVAVERYGLRAEVNEAFFTAVLLQERLRELDLLAEDLEARLREVESRVRAGAALPGDAAALEAELLEAEQAAAELAAGRRAALGVLGELTGRRIADDAVLVPPDLAAEVERVQAAGGPIGVMARPEYAQFERTRERLAEEADALAAERRPRAVAFGQVGYGKPGLNQFGNEFDEFWRGGVRVEWTPWRWGATDREREVLEIERRIVETRRAAFTERLERVVQDQLETMVRLEGALETDERIIALRERTERQHRRQFEEGVITASAYVDARTDLLEARVSRELHRTELAQARARYLTTLGIDPR